MYRRAALVIVSLILLACSSSEPAGTGGAGPGASGGGGSGAAGGAGGTGGATGDRFPLTHTAGERFLREASGKPFFFHGDTGWSLIAQLSKEDAEIYLEDRRQKGFTVILVSLLEHAFSDQAPNNIYGDPPFMTPGDYAAPNEAYFAHADWVIERAREKGLLLALTPSYIGYGGGSEGFYQEMTAAGVTTLEGYGHFLGQRYATASNILWVHAGDYNPPTPDLVDAIARGIRAETTLQLHTAHTSRNDTASNIWGQFPWLDVDNVYTDSETYAPSLALYQSTTTPFFLIEAYYEGEHNMSEEALRYQAYGALLGGAMGHMFGNNPMWCLGASTCFPTTATPPTWQGQLDGRGSLDMAALASAWAPLAWDKLVPSATLVSQDGTDARAALASDGALALVYTQSLGSFDLDLSGFAGPVDAVRIDPTDATETALPGSPFPNSGTRTVTLSDSNATGTDDWLLRFRVTP